MRVIPASTNRRMPWKNGGGETVEIAISPTGAALDDFDWRISMARVETPGPFSIFPEVDRTLAVLDGVGMTLHFSTRDAVSLTPASAPFAFPADAHVEADLPAGAITDLNVMTRRGRVRHRLRRLATSARTVLTCDSDELLLLVLGSSAVVRDGASEAHLASGDAVLSEQRMGGAFEIIPLGLTRFFVIELWHLYDWDGAAQVTAP
ncbi:HutD family protein [Microvirga sp. BT350]|uniref:HutD family protein n=2 Tax=Microvirga alba TaxID=2791025 RepID=A0A931BU78_9HYPH|nr:HutD family protein [Microvirga alba]MBF9233890.1 HutD family protein [Microvirga alba]